eukprot:386990-Pyramimonas_sp.AAC.1
MATSLSYEVAEICTTAVLETLADTVDELNEARRQGRRAEVARLSRVLAGTGVGPRKRDYRGAP